MQLTYFPAHQAADILRDSERLATIEGPGKCITHVLTCNGRDILMFVDSGSGDATIVDESAHDGDSGGSIHDHARAIFSSGDDT